MAKLTLSKKQEELLYLLRLEGLRREIELHEATEAYEKALEIEKAVHQYVSERIAAAREAAATQDRHKFKNI